MSKIFPFKEYMDHLVKLNEKPPYLIFIFISPLLLVITLLWQKYFELFFIFFIYSVVGAVWRHAVKDFRGQLEKSYGPDEFNKKNLRLTGFYQLINILLVITLAILLFVFLC